MKNKLFVLSLGLLTAGPQLYAAASSNEQKQITMPAMGVAGFLKLAGVCPDAIYLSRSDYIDREETAMHKVLTHLDRVEQEATPFVAGLFTMNLTEEQPLESFLHTFIVSRYAMAKFVRGSDKDSSITSSFAKPSSQPSSLAQIVMNIQEKEIRNLYWELLDEQPETHRDRLIVFDALSSTPKTAKKLTIGVFRTWLGIFKAAQASGEIPRDALTVANAIRESCNARREQIRNERAHVQNNGVSGLVALRMIKEQTSIMPTTAASSSSSSTKISSLFTWLS